jgi:hypothetical protein
MFKLHVFNPEHDIALGRDNGSFPLSKAVLRIRKAFAHIPVFWAGEGDWILVDDIASAEKTLRTENFMHKSVRLVTLDDLRSLNDDEMPSEIVPWGWDKHIVRTLLKANPKFVRLVPDSKELNTIRELSSRVFVASHILNKLISTDSRLIGEMEVYSGNVEKVNVLLKNRGKTVIKSPWSSSGRGVRFVESKLTENELGWCRKILQEQGAILLEPHYEKKVDFAMEFFIDKSGDVSFLGLNVFSTTNGYFAKNIIDTEENKRKFISKYIPIRLLDRVTERIISTTSDIFRNKYQGPFGVDMMIVKIGKEFRLHPCVELNLRFTMGHVALQKQAALMLK